MHKILVHYLAKRIAFLEKQQKRVVDDILLAKESMKTAGAMYDVLQEELDERRESHGRRVAIENEQGLSDDEVWDSTAEASSQIDPREGAYRLVGRKSVSFTFLSLAVSSSPC